jgi:hypothetical protein
VGERDLFLLVEKVADWRWMNESAPIKNEGVEFLF